MKFIENYQDRQWGILALEPQELDELKRRLDSDRDDIEIEDMFDQNSYKIERIRIVTDWKNFEDETEERDTNVKWTTTIMWTLFIALVSFALIGVFSIIKYVT